MMTFTMSYPLVLLIGLVSFVGCTAPAVNPRQPASESVVLTDVRQLTSGFARAGDARFSPDMRWVSFQATAAGEAADQVFLAPLQRDAGEIVGMGRPIRVTPAKSVNSGATIASDGLSIVLSSDAPALPGNEAATARRLSLRRADGWEPAVTSAEPGAIVDLTQHKLPTPDGAIDAQPSFSRDGKRIVFASQVGNDIDLYVADANGGNRVRVTDSPGFEGHPSFSPDGKRLVYTGTAEGSRMLDVFVCDLSFDAAGNVTGGNRHRALTDSADVQRAPTWTPDGRNIVYSSARVGQKGYRLRAMRADGSMRTEVTLLGPTDTAPSLSPDGRYLLWTARRSPDGSPQVFLARFTLPAGL